MLACFRYCKIQSCSVAAEGFRPLFFIAGARPSGHQNSMRGCLQCYQMLCFHYCSWFLIASVIDRRFFHLFLINYTITTYFYWVKVNVDLFTDCCQLVPWETSIDRGLSPLLVALSNTQRRVSVGPVQPILSVVYLPLPLYIRWSCEW